MQFPGFLAVIPVLGSGLVIMSGGGATFAATMLRSQPMVMIGRLSYALYLVHWPLIVYWRLIVGNDTLGVWSVALLAASFALAYLLWRFVEMPMRRI